MHWPGTGPEFKGEEDEVAERCMNLYRGVEAAAEWEHAADQRDGHLLQRYLRRGLWPDHAAVRGCLTRKVKHEGSGGVAPGFEFGNCVGVNYAWLGVMPTDDRRVHMLNICSSIYTSSYDVVAYIRTVRLPCTVKVMGDKFPAEAGLRWQTSWIASRTARWMGDLDRRLEGRDD